MCCSFPSRGGRFLHGVVAGVLAATTLGLGQTQTPNDYRVGPQDVLRITVFDEPDLTGAFTIDGDGSLTYPLVGRVTVEDSTVSEIQTELTRRLADGYLINPQVNVEVLEYRSQRIYVLGEVRSPGVYTLQGNMSLIEVLVEAGSTTATAGNAIHIVRRPDGQDSGPLLPEDATEADVTYVDLRDIQTGRLSTVALRDGDTVFVPRAETFFVTGQVRSPGSYAWQRGLTIRQALSLAGGLTERGSDRGIRIFRIVDGNQVEIDAALDDLVQAGDTIRARQRFF